MHVPSAPQLVDEDILGIRVFEKITRLGHPRRCSPFENSWVEVYRGVDDGRPVLLFCSRRDLRMSTREDGARRGEAVVEDALHWDLLPHASFVRAVRDARRSFATLAHFGGVRLRALVDATHAAGATLPPEVLVDVAVRSLDAVRALAAIGYGRFADTLVGFDGTLAILPRAEECARAEAASYVGNEVFDGLVIDDIGAFREVVTGSEPPPLFGLVPEGALAPLPAGTASSVARVFSRGAPPFPEACRAARRELGAVEPALLGAIAQRLFPEVHRRQREVEEDCAVRSLG